MTSITDAHGIDVEFANLLTTYLSSQQCLLMFIFFVSTRPESDKAQRVTGKLDDILSKRSDLLRSPKWKRFGKKECFSSIKSWTAKMRQTEMIESDIEMKLLTVDGLVLLNRTDLIEKVNSLYSRTKHKEYEVSLEEIKRHSGRNQTSSDDMSSDGYDEEEFRYEVLVFILVLSVAIFLIVAKSLISFQSKVSIISKPRNDTEK